MKLEGKITMLINRDYTTIEIEDSKASTTFVKVTLSSEQLSMILSRQAYVTCDIDVMGLEKVGKTHENKWFEFEIPESLKSSSKAKELTEMAQSQLTDGWIAEGYFSSKNTFFHKDDKQYARVVIRRYI